MWLSPGLGLSPTCGRNPILFVWPTGLTCESPALGTLPHLWQKSHFVRRAALRWLDEQNAISATKKEEIAHEDGSRGGRRGGTFRGISVAGGIVLGNLRRVHLLSPHFPTRLKFFPRAPASHPLRRGTFLPRDIRRGGRVRRGRDATNKMEFLPQELGGCGAGESGGAGGGCGLGRT